MMKELKYTIKAVISLPADQPGEISDVLERIREVGEAEIEKVEVVEGEMEKG